MASLTDQRPARRVWGLRRRLRWALGLETMNATKWRRATVASPTVWLPWVLVGVSAAAALFSAWWIWGTKAAVAFLAAWWPWLIIGAAGVVTVSVFVWWLWWRLPKRQVDELSAAITDAKARTDVEDNFRKTAGQLLGGAAVLLGAGAAYLQFSQQQQTTQRQFSQQQQAAQDLLISNQAAKAFELLGNEDGQIGQRLGGIYTLEGVMNASEQYHQPVLEALCAFVRDKTQPNGATSLTPDQVPRMNKDRTQQLLQDRLLSSPATDVQAALTVIGRRKEGAGEVDLRGAHIAKASLVHADLRGAQLINAELIYASLRGADLRGAELIYANLRAVNAVRCLLSGASLFGADLSGAFLYEADLSGADLRGAELTGADLADTTLTGADLSGARLGRAKNLTQGQLDAACGDGKTQLDPPLTIKPCPPQPAGGSSK